MSPYDAMYNAIKTLKEFEKYLGADPKVNYNSLLRAELDTVGRVIRDAENAFNDLIDRRSERKVSKSRTKI